MKIHFNKFIKTTFAAGLLLSSSLTFGAGKEIRVIAKGIVCSFCAQGVAKKLKQDPNVQNVDVILDKKLVKITLKDGKDMTNEQINEVIKNSGYDVEKIER